MSSRSPIADPSRFSITVAAGSALVLAPVLGFLFLERVVVACTTRKSDPVLLVVVVSLVLRAVIAYHLVAIVVFVASVATADGRRGIVERGDGDVTPELEQAAAARLVPAAVLGWLGNVASVKLAVAFRICGFVLHVISNVMLAARN